MLRDICTIATFSSSIFEMSPSKEDILLSFQFVNVYFLEVISYRIHERFQWAIDRHSSLYLKLWRLVFQNTSVAPLYAVSVPNHNSL